MQSLKFIASAIVGTAVGTLVGMLFSPSNGANNRQSLKRLAGEFSAQLPLRFDDLKRKVRWTRKGVPDDTFVQLYREGGG